jgi:uncharacterized protein (DUF952 family)
MQVFKILDTNEWKAAQEAGVYSGSAADKTDGFIHLSTSAQLATTLTKHFAKADNLTLVAVDTDALSSALKWEPSSNGDSYPHLYGDLDLAAVLWSTAIPKRPGGVFVLPVQAFTQAGGAPGAVN